MTELEIARGTRTTLSNIYTARAEALEASGGEAAIFTTDERALHKKWWAFWCDRLAELEAAEKGPKHDPVPDRLAALEARLDRCVTQLVDMVAPIQAKIEKIARNDALLDEIVRRFNNHFHDTFSERGAGTTGKPREDRKRNAPTTKGDQP